MTIQNDTQDGDPDRYWETFMGLVYTCEISHVFYDSKTIHQGGLKHNIFQLQEGQNFVKGRIVQKWKEIDLEFSSLAPSLDDAKDFAGPHRNWIT